jgi:hypothetical protein
MASTIYATMRQRRNTYAFFQQDNTLLEDGQLGIINSGQYKNCFKIGDGVTRWNTLPWVTDYQLLFNKPQVNGVNLSGNVSLSQLGVASAAGLTTEAQTRQQADTALTQALATEKTERQSADEALAPIESPHFTGVPTTPEPDYTVPDQIATVQDSIFMRDLILYTILDEARLTQNHNSFFGNTIRITCNGRIRGIYVD